MKKAANRPLFPVTIRFHAASLYRSLYVSLSTADYSHHTRQKERPHLLTDEDRADLE